MPPLWAWPGLTVSQAMSPQDLLCSPQQTPCLPIMGLHLIQSFLHQGKPKAVWKDPQ